MLLHLRKITTNSEHQRIKAYYLSPVALERVILGKNLGVFLYNGIILMLALVCWVATMGFPGVELLASSILLFCVGLLVFVATGNVVSVLFPVRRNISSMMNSPSQTAFLLSVVTLGIAASVASLGIFVSLVLGVGYLLPLFLIAILAGAIGLYYLGLQAAAGLMEQRKDRIIQTLRVKG